MHLHATLHALYLCVQCGDKPLTHMYTRVHHNVIDSIDSRIRCTILHNVICRCKISQSILYFSINFVLHIIITPRMVDHRFGSTVYLDSLMPCLVIGISNAVQRLSPVFKLQALDHLTNFTFTHFTDF